MNCYDHSALLRVGLLMILLIVLSFHHSLKKCVDSESVQEWLIGGDSEVMEVVKVVLLVYIA